VTRTLPQKYGVYVTSFTDLTQHLQ